MTASKSLPALVQDFFEVHLAVERHASPNTVMGYRDAIKLWLRFLADAVGRAPEQLDHAALDTERVRAFLGWLARERGCGARTRNHRLAAIKAFARYVASVAPEHLERCRKIREILPAHTEQREVGYLDGDEIARLAQATEGASAEHRDRALLLLLYNTGARVQEIVDLDLEDIHRETIPFVRLQGKGRKERTCPLWARTVEALDAWQRERGTITAATDPLFVNTRGQRLSRSGIAYILRRHAQRANLQPRHSTRVSPHVIRHTTAMHLLQSGVDITTIAAWLGHAQITTTHGYVQIDLRMKQAALAATVLPEMTRSTYPRANLLSWLDGVCRQPRYVQPRQPISPTWRTASP